MFWDLLPPKGEFRQAKGQFGLEAELWPRKKTVHRDLSHRGKRTSQLVLGTSGMLSSPVVKDSRGNICTK